MKTTEQIIMECFEMVGHFQGFNHPDVKSIMRKALKIQKAEMLKAVEDKVKKFDFAQYSDMGMEKGNQEMLIEDLLKELKG